MATTTRTRSPKFWERLSKPKPTQSQEKVPASSNRTLYMKQTGKGARKLPPASPPTSILEVKSRVNIVDESRKEQFKRIDEKENTEARMNACLVKSKQPAASKHASEFVFERVIKKSDQKKDPCGKVTHSDSSETDAQALTASGSDDHKVTTTSVSLNANPTTVAQKTSPTTHRGVALFKQDIQTKKTAQQKALNMSLTGPFKDEVVNNRLITEAANKIKEKNRAEKERDDFITGRETSLSKRFAKEEQVRHARFLAIQKIKQENLKKSDSNLREIAAEKQKSRRIAEEKLKKSNPKPIIQKPTNTRPPWKAPNQKPKPEFTSGNSINQPPKTNKPTVDSRYSSIPSLNIIPKRPPIDPKRLGPYTANLLGLRLPWDSSQKPTGSTNRGQATQKVPVRRPAPQR